MNSIAQIQVQKLFVVALILKVTSAFIGWYLQMPWSLGFALPLIVMVAYIVLGYFRKDTDVSDEKFADTCYYLGFIFTITSIIFSLFDLPNIGTRIQDIAVRFGAAMVSTVLGLGVRVYLVSFRQDINDAIKDAEDAVLDATRKFTEQLTIALERLRDFESQVDSAAKSTVERVNLQIENLSMNHANKLTEFFTELTTQNQKAFVLALGEVKTASRHLADSVDGYSDGMRANLSSIEAKVTAFADAVTTRLKTTTFPDDYFAKQLQGPLAQLSESAADISNQIKQASTEVGQSSTVLGSTLRKLREKANTVDASLDTVIKLTTQQQAVLDSAQGQLSTLAHLAGSLSHLDTTLTSTLAEINASNIVSKDLVTHVSALTSEGQETRNSLVRSLMEVSGKLESSNASTTMIADKLDADTQSRLTANETLAQKLAANADAANAAVNAIVSRLDASHASNYTLVTKLSDNVEASEKIVSRLNSIASADAQAIQQLTSLGLQAGTTIGKVEDAIGQLQAIVHQFSTLDSALRDQSADLKQVAEQIKDVKVIVEMSPMAGENLPSSAQISAPATLGASLMEPQPAEVN